MMIWTLIDAHGAFYGPFESLMNVDKFIGNYRLAEPMTLVQAPNGTAGSVRNVILTALEDAREAVRRG